MSPSLYDTSADYGLGYRGLELYMTDHNETVESEDTKTEEYWKEFVAEQEEEIKEFRECQQGTSSELRMEISEAIINQHDEVVIDVSPDVADDRIIRRYLSIPQFLSVMEGEHLWFNSALNFDDGFEGSLPKTNAKERELTAKFKEKTIKRKFGEGEAEKISSIDGIAREDEIHIGHCLVNCWRMGGDPDQYTESALFWNAYVPDGEGVAIESTVGQLKRQLMGRGNFFKDIRNSSVVPGFYPGVYAGSVRYIDYHDDWGLTLLPIRLFYKRDKFSEEQEFRAVVDKFERRYLQKLEGGGSEDFEYNLPSGDYVDIDRRELINKIIVAPDAPSHLYDNIEKLTQRYDEFDASDVKPSMLDREDPTY